MYCFSCSISLSLSLFSFVIKMTTVFYAVSMHGFPFRFHLIICQPSKFTRGNGHQNCSFSAWWAQILKESVENISKFSEEMWNIVKIIELNRIIQSISMNNRFKLIRSAFVLDIIEQMTFRNHPTYVSSRSLQILTIFFVSLYQKQNRIEEKDWNNIKIPWIFIPYSQKWVKEKKMKMT